LHEKAVSWDRNVGGIVRRYCIDCHSAGEASGNVNLEEDSNVRDIRNRRDKWQRVRSVLESGEMPPADADELAPEKRKQFLDFIAYALDNIDCESIDGPGPPVLRRLNRVEYDNAIEDLTGLRLGIASSFPADPIAFGFDNTGTNASLSPAEVEMYHAASKQIMASVRESEARIRNRVFGPSPDANASSDELRSAAQKAIQQFAQRAFRGQVDEYYVNRLVRIFDRGISEGLGYSEALSNCLTATLISPRFLFRLEEDRKSDSPMVAVGDFELANRLSFLLWSRGADEELLTLARQGSLSAGQGDAWRATVEGQVDRMLRDDRSIALADNFFAQWLDLKRLSTYAPDKTAFPDFTAELRDSMHQEVRRTLLAIIRDELPISGLIDAPAALVDQRLIEFYGLESPDSGPGGASVFTSVEVLDSGRGGLLGSAGFLMLQADPDRTNIPRRGNFIMGQLLGIAPPPPPPDVPELEVGASDEKLSLREIFEKHRSAAECKGCHAKIDPIGFSLENFDAMGRFRELDRGVPIDSTGALPDGTELDGIRGLKAYLLSER
jgi:hypothetical protein